jgi:hypothetical protein
VLRESTLCSHNQRTNRNCVLTQGGESDAWPWLKSIHDITAQMIGNRAPPCFAYERDAAPEYNDLRVEEMNHMGKSQSQTLSCLADNTGGKLITSL